MAEYESVEQLNELFKTGRVLDLPANIAVNGFIYNIKDSIQYPIPQMLDENLKSFVIYSSSGQSKQDPKYQELVQQGHLQEWIIFIWAITRELDITPTRVVANTAARAQTDLQTASRMLGEGPNTVIYDEEEILFVPFNKRVLGKVDTGANMSSIHADDWQINKQNGTITFISSLLSPNKIMLKMEDQVVVKTSEGTEYRPVVAFDIDIKGKKIKGAKFNLNDRSGMAHPLLIGQNILEKGQFLVDPNRQSDTITTEEKTWDDLQEEYKDLKPDNTIRETRDIYNILLDTDLSFQDIVRHIKTLAQESLEKIEY